MWCTHHRTHHNDAMEKKKLNYDLEQWQNQNKYVIIACDKQMLIFILVSILSSQKLTFTNLILATLKLCFVDFFDYTLLYPLDHLISNKKFNPFKCRLVGLSSRDCDFFFCYGATFYLLSFGVVKCWNDYFIIATSPEISKLLSPISRFHLFAMQKRQKYYVIMWPAKQSSSRMR